MSKVLKKLKPRHLEIIRQMCIGKSDGDICRDLGMSPSTLNVIKNSPIFKNEFRRMQRNREEKIYKIQDTLIDAGVSGAELHKDIIQDAALPLPIRMRSATDILNIVGRITKSTVDSFGGDVPYETKLREIILRETTTTHPGNGNGEEQPAIGGDSAIDDVVDEAWLEDDIEIAREWDHGGV
jgi:hypothetical protein